MSILCRSVLWAYLISAVLNVCLESALPEDPVHCCTFGERKNKLPGAVWVSSSVSLGCVKETNDTVRNGVLNGTESNWLMEWERHQGSAFMENQLWALVGLNRRARVCLAELHGMRRETKSCPVSESKTFAEVWACSQWDVAAVRGRGSN